MGVGGWGTWCRWHSRTQRHSLTHPCCIQKLACGGRQALAPPWGWGWQPHLAYSGQEQKLTLFLKNESSKPQQTGPGLHPTRAGSFPKARSSTLPTTGARPVSSSTHYLWMRATIVLKAAWTSAMEQVETTGCLWAWSCSLTYYQHKAREKARASHELLVCHTMLWVPSLLCWPTGPHKASQGCTQTQPGWAQTRCPCQPLQDILT